MYTLRRKIVKRKLIVRLGMGKENLEDFAYKAIIKLILGNHFKPGDFLLETELSDRLKLSRTPVRHALGQLVAGGFLDKKKKKGCFIPLPSIDDAKQVFFARENIEYQTTVSMTLHASDKEIQVLRDILEHERVSENTGDKFGSYSANKGLHIAIASSCKNRYLEQYCRHIFWRSNTYIFFFDDYYIKEDYGKQKITPMQHKAIVDAIENRNAEKAGNLMKQHIRETFERLFVKL